MSILLIQSPSRHGQSLLSGLDAEHGTAEYAPTLAEALILARQRRFEAFVLDLRRTRLDAAAAVRDLRRYDELAAMVVIGGRLSLEERLHLLEAGADECLAEPLSEKELEVRLRVLLRRTARLRQRLSLGDLELPPEPPPRQAHKLRCNLQHPGFWLIFLRHRLTFPSDVRHGSSYPYRITNVQYVLAWQAEAPVRPHGRRF